MASRNTLSTNVWDAVYTYIQTTNPISTNNIFSAYNSTLAASNGYPLVIIYPPLVPYDKLSVNGFYTNSEISILIEIYHTSAQNVKAVKDEVVAKLLAGRHTLSGQGFKRMNLSAGGYDFWTEGEKKIHRLSFDVTFTYIEGSA